MIIMNLSKLKKGIIALVGIVLMASGLNGQCVDPDLAGLSWTPQVPGTQDELRIVVAREYENGCSGLQTRGNAVVDHSAKTITVYYDQFCLDSGLCLRDSLPHCDTAHYVITDLDTGIYDIIVVDSVSANHMCSGSSHEDVLYNGNVTVRDVVITSDTVAGKRFTIQCLPYTFDGFQGVNTLQTVLTWDTLKVRFDTVRNLHPISYFDFASFGLRSPGDLRVIWYDFDVDGESVPDNTVLFEVCFDLVGLAPDTADITFNTSLLNTEIEDVDGDTLAIITNPGRIIISNDFYPPCELDTSNFLCQDWVKDTVNNGIATYCNVDSGYFQLDFIDWRGWNILKISRGYITQTGPLGEEVFLTCDGEVLGTCIIGGFGGGFCDMPELGNDTSHVKKVWSCGEKLPGCYTVGNNTQYNEDVILTSNLVDDHLKIKSGYIGQTFEIYNVNGQRILNGTLNKNIDISKVPSGTYWIKSGNAIETFVKLD